MEAASAVSADLQDSIIQASELSSRACELLSELKEVARIYNSTESLGNLIKMERKKQKMTQRELADLCGLSAPTVAKLEKGDKRASLENIERVLTVLGRSLWIR